MLTDTKVRAARATENPYKLADSRGLYLQVNPNGGRYWRFNYRFNGKQKTLALGTYPDVPLARARERHYEARRELAEGIDPGAAKQAVSRDFETVARAWLAHWRPGRSERYVDYVVTRLEGDVFPDIGARPVAELTAAEFRDAVRKVERRGAAEIARRLNEKGFRTRRGAEWSAPDVFQLLPRLIEDGSKTFATDRWAEIRRGLFRKAV